MKIKCKVGDMAVLLQSNYGNTGRFFEVLEPIGAMGPDTNFEHRGRKFLTGPSGGFFWWVRPLGGPANTNIGRRSDAGVARDAVLQPIRPPGNDAKTKAAEPKRQEITT